MPGTRGLTCCGTVPLRFSAMQRPSSGAATAFLSLLLPQLLAACLRQPPSYRPASVSRPKSTLTNSARAARVTRSGCLQTDQLWTAQYDTNPYATGKHLLLPYKCAVLPRSPLSSSSPLSSLPFPSSLLLTSSRCPPALRLAPAPFLEYRAASLIRNRPPSRTTIGPEA